MTRYATTEADGKTVPAPAAPAKPAPAPEKPSPK